MAFDRNKVQFNDNDLKAAEAMDSIYEALREAGEFDLGVIASQVGNLQIVIKYLTEDSTREDLADRLFDLGVMFKRDNIDFNRPSTPS